MFKIAVNCPIHAHVQLVHNPVRALRCPCLNCGSGKTNRTCACDYKPFLTSLILLHNLQSGDTRIFYQTSSSLSLSRTNSMSPRLQTWLTTACFDAHVQASIHLARPALHKTASRRHKHPKSRQAIAVIRNHRPLCREEELSDI